MISKIVTLQVLSLACWPGTVNANSDPSTHWVQDTQDPSCLYKSPIQEWSSRLLVEDLLARSNKKARQYNANSIKAEANEKRRKTKRRGSLQLLIQGHNRTNGKMNARTRYQVELVNSMKREVKALIIIAPVNQTDCGLGTLICNEPEKESLIFTDNCYLKAETLLPAKAKRDFTWMTPGCGCLNVSAHFAFHMNNKLTLMNPKSLKDTLPNKIVCVGPNLSRAEQMAEVRHKIMKQREAKLQRKRGRRQRQNRAGQQLTNGRPTKKTKTSSMNAGRNWISDSNREEAATFDQEIIADAEVILGREGRDSPGEDEDSGDDEEEESVESDETSESEEEEEDDEDENEEVDSSSIPFTEGNKRPIQGRNKINNLKGKKREKMAKRRRHLQKIRRGGRKRGEGLTNKNKGARGNNFRGLRLCCRQGIKHKKSIVYRHPQQNKDQWEGCDEASSELLAWVKENVKISERFCSRRFTQCCLGWRASAMQDRASNSIQNDS